MKHKLLFTIFSMFALVALGQQTVSIHDVQYVSPSDLANCNDTSAYLGDTVTVYGVAIHDGNLTEIASGSVQGGYRPAISLVDTSANGAMGPFKGIQIHGVYQDASGQNLPVDAINSIIAGSIVQVTGVVGRYQGETQIYPLDNSSVVTLSIGSAPAPVQVSVGDLNNANRENQLPTGEQWEDAFVELTNVTVVSVNFFAGGSRVSFDVADANGNTINVSDRFLAQKLPSHTTVNPQSPASTGSFVAPPVGTQYASIKGIIQHSENGCTGANGRGYEINPFDASHYVIGVAPPNFTDVKRNPVVPKSTEVATVTCKITDFDGTIASAKLHYTDNVSSPSFTAVNMTLVSGTTDEYTVDIPAFPDGTMIGYYLEAEDNDGNITTYPFTPASQPVKNMKIYTVRDNGPTIVDIQKVIDYNEDESYYLGDTLTVTGVVTASFKDYDLGYVYIQQPGESEWSGLSLYGSSDLATLLRMEEVEVTGVVRENYGYTRMEVLSVNKTGNVIANETYYFDPSDDNLYTSGEIEKYEGMLVGLVNPSGGLYITDENLGFGDYSVGSSASASRSTRVLTARQSNSAFSSLWVSLIADSMWITNDGEMEVPPVLTTPTMEMDTLIGMVYYSFGNYRVLPRNNDDIIGLSDNGVSIPLDSTDLQLPDTSTAIVEIGGVKIETVIYPNPANEMLNIEIKGQSGKATAVIYDMMGREVSRTVVWQGVNTVPVDMLDQGVYILRITDEKGNRLFSEPVTIQ